MLEEAAREALAETLEEMAPSRKSRASKAA
jgi:hypothetical protein